MFAHSIWNCIKEEKVLTKETSIMFSNVYGFLMHQSAMFNSIYHCCSKCSLCFVSFLMHRIELNQTTLILILTETHCQQQTMYGKSKIWMIKHWQANKQTKTVSEYVVTRKTTTLGHTWWWCAFEVFSSWYCLMAFVLYVVPFSALFVGVCVCVYVIAVWVRARWLVMI